MRGFVDDIEKLTEENGDFRRVLYTGKNLQLVLMSIQPGDDIGEEVHDDRDQFFRVEQGKGEVWIDGNSSKVEADDAFIVPAGARHNVKCTGEEALRVYTLYGPPEHRDGTVHATKADAEVHDEHFDGKTTEVSLGSIGARVVTPMARKTRDDLSGVPNAAVTIALTVPARFSGLYDWRADADGWRIGCGPSNFLLAEGSAWSTRFGEALYTALSTVRGKEPRPGTTDRPVNPNIDG